MARPPHYSQWATSLLALVISIFLMASVLPATAAWFLGELSPPTPNAACHILAAEQRPPSWLRLRYDVCTDTECRFNQTVIVLGTETGPVTPRRMMRDFYAGHRGDCYVDGDSVSWEPCQEYMELRAIFGTMFVIGVVAVALTAIAVHPSFPFCKINIYLLRRGRAAKHVAH